MKTADMLGEGSSTVVAPHLDDARIARIVNNSLALLERDMAFCAVRRRGWDTIPVAPLTPLSRRIPSCHFILPSRNNKHLCNLHPKVWFANCRLLCSLCLRCRAWGRPPEYQEESRTRSAL